MAGSPSIRSADALIGPAVAETLQELELTPENAAAARLASVYARAIDSANEDDRAKVLAELGPKLLACLVELRATPRAAAKGGVPTRVESRLAGIRASRTN